MLAFIAYRTADLLVRLLPARAADGLGVGLARAAFAFGPRARAAQERNLAALLGERADTRRWSRQAFEHFALALTDFLRLARCGSAARPVRPAVEIRGAHHLARARAQGRGVIVLSAHVGSWERGAALLATLGPRVHVLARPHPSAAVERFFAHRRRRLGVASLAGPGLRARALRALERGDWIAVMGDRPAARHGGSLCALAGALARRTGARVVPAVMRRLPDGRHAACFEAPLDPGRDLARAYRDALRRHVVREPGQWAAFEPLPGAIA
jgi:Kdo2-lipid IVA lauroyltransferase/acyltransferase